MNIKRIRRNREIPDTVLKVYPNCLSIMNLESFTREDFMMNKYNLLVLITIIIIIIFVMGTGACALNQQDMKRQKEETIGWFVSSAWTDWNESNSIQEISVVNDQAESRIILLAGIDKDESENASHPEVKIVIEEINDGSDKQPQYAIQVDFNSEYIGSQNWKINIINNEEKYPPKFKITEGQIDCTITSTESALLHRTEKRKIDGQIYCIESSSEGAAGTIYAQYAYFTIKNGCLIMVSCVIRYPQCMNYDEPHRAECENERETFDLDKIIGHIVKNIIVKESEMGKE